MEESLLVKKASLTTVFWKVVFSTEYSSMCKVNCFPWKSKSSQNIYFFTITRRAKNLCAPVPSVLPKITCCSLWGRDWGALHWHVRQVQAWLKHCLVFFSCVYSILLLFMVMEVSLIALLPHFHCLYFMCAHSKDTELRSQEMDLVQRWPRLSWRLLTLLYCKCWVCIGQFVMLSQWLTQWNRLTHIHRARLEALIYLTWISGMSLGCQLKMEGLRREHPPLCTFCFLLL